MLNHAIRSLAVTLALGTGTARADEPLFPFVVSYDAPENVTNVSGWIERPAGLHGHVRAEGGSLVTDAGPIRFWATNLCFEACFPSHDEAEQVAARLARLGTNCVRMHHMDSHSIWGNSPNKTIIDPEKLDRLDYLVHQLKRHGVYTDLNLHVSRTLGDKEGFPHADRRPKYDKGVGNFEPRMIELQKKYARDLLTHKNPYTGTDYAHEPAVAFVEISNEDALFNIWGRGQLDDLPEPYAGTFRGLWNARLKEKHGSTDGLGRAWGRGEEPPGEEMLRGGDFSAPPESTWHLDRDDQTEVRWSVDGDGPGGKPRLVIEVTRQGKVPWLPQFHQGKLAVEKGKSYTLTFQLKADRERNVGVNCMMAHEPWSRLGLSAHAKAGPEWEPFRFTFVADRDDANARITFTDLEPGTYGLAAVSLRPGGIEGLRDGERPEDGTLEIIRRSGGLARTADVRNDWVDFLWDTERDYWWGMYRFLKDELDCQALVSGTQLSYSPVHVQAGLDYIDAHSYWNHPSFPGRPWDPRNWYVRNVALVNSPGGTLAGLAARRVAGMAFTVSEYNHPAPNQYAAEGFPMIAAFGAFQSWDGIFPFTYSHSTDFQPRKITGFFDVKSDPTRLVHMPACAALFLRGDVAPAKETIRVPLSPRREREKLHETMSASSLTAERLGLDGRWSLVHGVALDPAAKEAGELPEFPADRQVFASDTGEIVWDVSGPGEGRFTVHTPRTILVTGFIDGAKLALGNVELQFGKTRLGWATVSMVAMDAQDFKSPGHILIAATGLVQNQGAELEQLGGDRVTLGNRWGSEPTLCEGIPLGITMPVPADRLQFCPLDESGNRREAVPVDDRSGQSVLRLSPEHRTLWYEVEVR